MTDFQTGELVDITIRGAQVTEVLPGSVAISYATAASECVVHVANIHTGATGVEVTRVAPAEWPPETGDVWRDRENVLWFISVREVGDDFRTEKVFTPSSTRAVNRYAAYQASRLLDERGPMALVHRERPEPDDSDEPDGSEPPAF
ncbi:hypothetical protein OOJ91_11970 [Micromonospora lupini]|uniref:hypothetical protein n=1 Tax=Micromonospora lupini TaxID=285679 RepID=UPI0022533AF3|nr:hypothetical protein [Micromonospora lupini]MCX5066594.1 hypothetical protein [Micromonospora lupini]